MRSREDSESGARAERLTTEMGELVGWIVWVVWVYTSTRGPGPADGRGPSGRVAQWLSDRQRPAGRPQGRCRADVRRGANGGEGPTATGTLTVEVMSAEHESQTYLTPPSPPLVAVFLRMTPMPDGVARAGGNTTKSRDEARSGWTKAGRAREGSVSLHGGRTGIERMRMG